MSSPNHNGDRKVSFSTPPRSGNDTPQKEGSDTPPNRNLFQRDLVQAACETPYKPRTGVSSARPSSTIGPNRNPFKPTFQFRGPNGQFYEMKGHPNPVNVIPMPKFTP